MPVALMVMDLREYLISRRREQPLYRRRYRLLLQKYTICEVQGNAKGETSHSLHLLHGTYDCRLLEGL
jgi:hypothetical protein